MNSETVMTVEEMAKREGAIVSCPTCFSYDVHAEDEDADRMTYAEATNAWKRRHHDFYGMTREEVMGVVKGVLNDAFDNCPNCSAAGY